MLARIPKNYLFGNTDLKRLIIPLIIEQFLTVIVGLVDSVMVAGVGEAAVSAISLVDTVNVLIVNMFTALAMGGAVVAGQYIGMKKENDACRAANQTLLFTTLAAVGIMILVYILRNFILHTVFGKIEDDVSAYANTYLLIVSASIPFIGMYNAGAAMFRAMGDSKAPMTTSLIMNAVNIIGNAVLIYGFHMEIAGAAIPTLISRILAAFIITARLGNQRLQIHIERPFSIKFDGRMIKKILRVGIPNSLENSMFRLGKIMVLTIVTAFGTAAITANAVSNTIAMFQILPGMAISQSVLTVVSQCVGANDFKQADFYVKRLLKILYICMFIINALVILSMPLILKAYNLSEETTSIARTILIYHAVCACTIWGVSFALPNSLRAANDVMFTMIVAVVSMWVFRIGASIVLANWLGLGVLGVWIAMTIDWFVRGVIFTARYRVKILKKARQTVKTVKNDGTPFLT
ncbi:MAG: MATE family efflux transporter [Firmicutes bacterium]|nr:MATE family efflux transporter [Bacillota bacterium]